MVEQNAQNREPGADYFGRVLIHGINYFPEETGNAPYTTGIAEYLAAAGNDVHIVAGMPYYPYWEISEEYRRSIRKTEVCNGVTVHRYRQYVPAKQTAIRRALFELSFFLHPLMARKLPKPDLILGVMPNLSDGALAVVASKRYSVPFGLLIQDLLGQSAAQSGIRGGGKVAGITKAIEGWISRKAAGIAIVAEGFRPRLVELGVDPNRIYRVRNWTHVGQAKRDVTDIRAELGIPQDAFVVLHAGNMGLKQGLENVIDAARLAVGNDSRLLLVMMGDGNQRKMIEHRAEGLSNVRFLPPQPEENFPNVLAAADVLLVNQRPSVVDMSLPGKLTSYFSSGRPVVAAVACTSETRHEIEAAQAGIVVESGDPAILLSAILELADDPARAEELGKNGQCYQQQHLTADAALHNFSAFLNKIKSAK